MKQFLLLILCMCLLSSCELTINKDIKSDYLVSGMANGSLDSYLSHNQVFRYEGKPGIMTIPVGLSNLSDYEKCFVLYVSSGSDPSTAASSASVKLDGMTVLAPTDFNNKSVLYKFEVCDLTLQSVLEIEVKGTPGSCIEVWIEGKKLTTVTDVDQNVYNIVKIGDQIWMKENLKVTNYNNNIPIPNIMTGSEWNNLSTGAYCWYDNNESYKNTTYGAIYNWFAVNTGILCPTGWHVPTDDEWKILEMNLGMTQEQADGYWLRGTDEGSKLKSTSGWINDGNGTNSSGFTAQAAGFFSTQPQFSYFGVYGVWWTASDAYDIAAWDRYLINSTNSVGRDRSSKIEGFSVRCLKNN